MYWITPLVGVIHPRKFCLVMEKVNPAKQVSHFTRHVQALRGVSFYAPPLL